MTSQRRPINTANTDPVALNLLFKCKNDHFVGCEDSCDDEYANFQLKADEGGDLSDESFRSSTNDRTTEDSCESVWESSVSEFETAMEDDPSENRERDQRFKANRAQHYFMKQALQHGKELLETDDDSESENETHNGIGIGRK